jgi:phosphonatase-like hydrolase
MEQKIKMVVFDMAGTTIDENNLVYKTLRKAINEAGFDFTLDQVLAEGAGKEKKQAIRSVLAAFAGIEDEEFTANIYANFLPQLTEAYLTADIIPQPNALELFAELKRRGIYAVLNTGYDRTTAQSIITKLGWQEGVDYDAMVTATDVGKNRPDPAMIVFRHGKIRHNGCCWCSKSRRLHYRYTGRPKRGMRFKHRHHHRRAYPGTIANRQPRRSNR